MHLHASILLILLFYGGFSSLKAQPEAIDSLEKVLAADPEESVRMHSLIQLAEQLQFIAPAKGIEHAREAQKIAESRKDTFSIAGALSRMGSCYEILGNLDESEKIRRQALSLYLYLGKAVDIGKQYTNLATIFDARGELDSAIYFYEKSLQLYSDGGTAMDSAIVFNNLGIVYERQAKYALAADIYLWALRSFERAGHEYYTSFAHANLGNIYLLMEDEKRAKHHFNSSLIIKKKHGDRIGQAIVYNNMAKLYLSASATDSAIYFNEESLAIRQELGDTLGMIDVYINLGGIYRDQDQLNKGIPYLRKAYEFAQFKAVKIQEAKAAVQLARAYIDSGQRREAMRLLQKGINLSSQGGEPETRLMAYKSLAQLYQKEGNPKGFEFYDKAIALEDSLRNDEETRKITRLEMQYEFDKEKEFLELEQQKQELAFNAELDRQRFQRNISLGGIASGLIILLLLWRSYRIQKRNRALLQTQNVHLEEALRDRENLLKEIHHRVKNNLQVVSSLLSLQSRSIDDPVALDAIEEGRNRVKAMGLIHQNLYQEENLIGVNLPEYIEKLTDNLLESYKVQQSNIHISRKVEALSIDVDTLIPLGLILNELISNSLKYAFKGRDEGNIRLLIGKNEEGLKIEVADDGVGLPKGFNPEESPSMGFKLIRAFVQKMKAKFEVVSEQGTQVKIFLPETQAQIQLS
ncbi:MAG: tetratricopeptide repeat protein [Bacteroidota bacterium]